MKTNKKGFTIVELTIVIAVIAILAAVLIPTFVSLVKKADNSADVQMVTNINKYLASIEAIDGRNETMADAMADAAEVGYTKGAFQNLSSGNTILWDEDNDRFLAINENGKVVAGEIKSMKNEYGKYWIVSQNVNDKYATYLVGKVTNFDAIKLGLDLTEYTGDAPTITVGAENVKINGVVKALDANGKNPTVYGYVAELTGNVVSKNATFDKCEKVDTKLISGDFKLEHYPDSTGTKCQFCGAELVEVPVDHVHNYELKNDKCKDANCTSIGLKWYECSCGSAKVETVDALGHDEVQHEAQAATCTDKGWDAYVTCSRSGCDYKTYKEINPTGHGTIEAGTAELRNATEATCTEDGFSGDIYCKACNTKILDGETINALKHPEKNRYIKDSKEKSCTDNGYTGDTWCSLCNRLIENGETIWAGHKWEKTSDATCVAREIQTCSVCSTTQEVGELTGHQYTNSFCKTCNRYEHTIVMTQDSNGKITLTMNGKVIESGTLHIQNEGDLQAQTNAKYFDANGTMHIELGSDVSVKCSDLTATIGTAQHNTLVIQNLDLNLNGHTLTLKKTGEHDYLEVEEKIAISNGTLKHEGDIVLFYAWEKGTKLSFSDCTVYIPEDSKLVSDDYEAIILTATDSHIYCGEQEYDNWTDLVGQYLV